MSLVVFNKLAELLFLGLPDVASLATVRENFNTVRHVDASLRRSALRELADGLSVGADKVWGLAHRARPHRPLEVGVVTVSVRVAFRRRLILFIRALLVRLCSELDLALRHLSARLASFRDRSLRGGPASLTLHLSSAILGLASTNNSNFSRLCVLLFTAQFEAIKIFMVQRVSILTLEC